MERYFYFGQTTTFATGDACMFPLSSFLGMDSSGATETTMYFKGRNGTAIDDNIVVTHTACNTKTFMTEFCKFMQRNHKNTFLMMGSKSGLLPQHRFVSDYVDGYVINTTT
mgnify:CR=1 FL=1